MQEADKLLVRRLPIPAYDHILKLSHIFNLLDARGAVGFTERQDNFARMRNLARRVSEVFQERRQELEFPLGKVPAIPVRFCCVVGCPGRAGQCPPPTPLIRLINDLKCSATLRACRRACKPFGVFACAWTGPRGMQL